MTTNTQASQTDTQKNLRFPSFVIEISTLHNNDSGLLECDLHFQRCWMFSSFKIKVSPKRREPLPQQHSVPYQTTRTHWHTAVWNSIMHNAF